MPSRVDSETQRAQFDRLYEFTDLKPFAGRLAGQPSGGMKQKLGLACALVTTPRLLLLDEPGVGVDPGARRELWAMVATLANDIGILWSARPLEKAEADQFSDCLQPVIALSPEQRPQ